MSQLTWEESVNRRLDNIEKRLSNFGIKPEKEATDCISCPFCKKNDFDLIGLKDHLERGYCNMYNNVYK